MYGMSRTTQDLKVSLKECIKWLIYIYYLYVHYFLRSSYVISWCKRLQAVSSQSVESRLGMNQDSKLMKKGITWLPPLFALNMFTHLTILRD